MLPTARDPCNVQETVCNGPFNLAISGNLAFLTFTSVRPDPQEMMYGTGQPNFICHHYCPAGIACGDAEGNTQRDQPNACQSDDPRGPTQLIESLGCYGLSTSPTGFHSPCRSSHASGSASSVENQQPVETYSTPAHSDSHRLPGG
jgi:hypothetical protein